MNNNINLKSYFKELRKSLPYTSTKSAKLIRDLKYSISEYCNEHPDALIDDIITEFGTPEEIANFTVTTLEPKKLKKRLSLQQWIIFGIIIIVSFFIFVYSAAYIRGKYTIVNEKETYINVSDPKVVED